MCILFGTDHNTVEDEPTEPYLYIIAFNRN